MTEQNLMQEGEASQEGNAGEGSLEESRELWMQWYDRTSVEQRKPLLLAALAKLTTLEAEETLETFESLFAQKILWTVENHKGLEKLKLGDPLVYDRFVSRIKETLGSFSKRFLEVVVRPSVFTLSGAKKIYTVGSADILRKVLPCCTELPYPLNRKSLEEALSLHATQRANALPTEPELDFLSPDALRGFYPSWEAHCQSRESSMRFFNDLFVSLQWTSDKLDWDTWKEERDSRSGLAFSETKTRFCLQTPSQGNSFLDLLDKALFHRSRFWVTPEFQINSKSQMQKLLPWSVNLPLPLNAATFADYAAKLPENDLPSANEMKWLKPEILHALYPSTKPLEPSQAIPETPFIYEEEAAYGRALAAKPDAKQRLLKLLIAYETAELPPRV